VLLSILKIAGIGLGSLFVLGMVLVKFMAYWSRRGQGRPDLPSSRTIAVFAGAEQYVAAAEEAEAEQNGPGEIGKGLITALAAAINATAARADEPDADDCGWGTFVKVAAAEAYVLIGVSEHSDASGYNWIVQVNSRNGGPGAPEVLPFVDAALRSLTGVRNLAWHRRERFDVGDTSGGSASPID
jgi:hypothetical protein